MIAEAPGFQKQNHLPDVIVKARTGSIRAGLSDSAI
jgi:hypothetical protein